MFECASMAEGRKMVALGELQHPVSDNCYEGIWIRVRIHREKIRAY